MGAKLHFSTESSAMIVTAEFAAQGHLDSALGPAVLGGAWTEGFMGQVGRRRYFPPEFSLINVSFK